MPEKAVEPITPEGINLPLPPRILSQLPREKAAAAIRAFVLLTVTIMARFQSPAAPDALEWVLGIGAAYVLITSFSPLLLQPSQRLAIVLTLVDIGLITAIVYFSGGVGSEHYLLYYLPILNAAIRLDFRDGVGASALAAACFIFVGVVQWTGGEATPHLLSRTVTFSISSILLAGAFAFFSHEARAQQQLSQWYRKANEDKAEFVNHASHELRTPLTAIMGFSDLLNGQELEPDKQQEYLTIIKSQAERLARLIENILEMSRLEAGRIKLTLAPVALKEAVAGAAKQLSTANGNVKINLPEDLPAACADPRRLQQIVRILLDNAISYSGDEPVEIAARLEEAGATAEPMLRLWVKDHGPGIPEEDRPHIFEIFYNATNAAGRQGTGLSLAIARRLAELQDGEIEADSPAEGGAVFSLTLPAWKEPKGS
jgi:signal transduction histidine kinase